jgi:hypothetical protein
MVTMISCPWTALCEQFRDKATSAAWAVLLAYTLAKKQRIPVRAKNRFINPTPVGK